MTPQTEKMLMTGLEVLAEGAFLGTAAKHEIDKER
jgi:hypothetical protein